MQPDGPDRADAWLQAAALALGQHALPWFGAGLLLVLAATVLAWQLLPRALQDLPRTVGERPALVLLVCLACGLAVVALAGSVFAEMAEAMEAGTSLGRFDDTLAVTLRRSLAPGTLRAFAIVTHLGDVATLWVLGIAVAALLLWRRRPWLALGWSVALAGNGIANRMLKSVFVRVRPLHDQGIAVADGWSFPSGHASASVVAYGMLAYLLVRALPQRSAHRRLPLVLAAAALAYTVGCSRVVLQVHYASDVIAGFAAGSAWLAACVLGIEALRRARRTGSAGSL